MVKIFRKTFRVVKQWLPNRAHTNGRLPLKLHTTVKEGITNLEKKLITVSIYARGLIGPVRVKFDQMVYNLIYLMYFYLDE